MPPPMPPIGSPPPMPMPPPRAMLGMGVRLIRAVKRKARATPPCGCRAAPPAPPAVPWEGGGVLRMRMDNLPPPPPLEGAGMTGGGEITGGVVVLGPPGKVVLGAPGVEPLGPPGVVVVVPPGGVVLGPPGVGASWANRFPRVSGSRTITMTKRSSPRSDAAPSSTRRSVDGASMGRVLRPD